MGAVALTNSKNPTDTAACGSVRSTKRVNIPNKCRSGTTSIPCAVRPPSPTSVTQNGVPDVEVVWRHIADHVCCWIRRNARHRNSEERCSAASLSRKFTSLCDADAVMKALPQNIVNTFCWLFRVLHIEAECAIAIAIYLRRLLVRGLLLTQQNYEQVLLGCTLLATKIWDDRSTGNRDFVKAMPHYTLPKMNELEVITIQNLDWRLHINAQEYTIFFRGLHHALTLPANISGCTCALGCFAKSQADMSATSNLPALPPATLNDADRSCTQTPIQCDHCPCACRFAPSLKSLSV